MASGLELLVTLPTSAFPKHNLQSELIFVNFTVATKAHELIPKPYGVYGAYSRRTQQGPGMC